MINWGIIGCGEIAGKRVADAIKASKNCRLKAVARRDEEKAAEFARLHAVEKYYKDAALMLEDNEIQAVYIATPVYLHHEHAILSAVHGKHVLCEKPMALDAGQCRDMIEQCRKNGVHLSVVYYRRFYPKILKIKEMLDKGCIGKAIYARAQFSEIVTSEDIRKKSWLVEPEMSGGGPLMDMGSHMIDLLCFCLGRPVSVTAFTDKINIKYKVEDTSTLIIRFQSGCHGVINSSFSVSGSPQVEIFGTKGRLTMESVDDDAMKLIDNSNNVTRFSLPRSANANIPIIEDFAEAVEQRRSPRITGEEGMLASIVIDAAYRSSRSGKSMELAQYED